jgi:cytochrome b561
MPWITAENRRYLTAMRAGHRVDHLWRPRLEQMASGTQLGAHAVSRADAAALAVLQPAYTPLARLLHWTTAALVLMTIPMGFIMVEVLKSGPLQNFLFTLHESLGITLMAIVSFRLAHRATHRPAPLPAEIPALYRRAGHSVHWLLYALLAVQPIVGWIGTSAYRAPIHFFWLVELPPIWRQDRGLSDQILWVHTGIGIALAVLICAHVGAGLFHQFIRRDQVLMRMLRG